MQMMCSPQILDCSFLHLFMSNWNLFNSISHIHLALCAAPSHYCHWAYACVSGSQLHVGSLSPSHTSGAGRGTERPEGLNFLQLPIPPLLSSFLCLLAFQEDASQVLGNMCAALLPSSTYTLSFYSRLTFHISAPNFSLLACVTSTLHVFCPKFIPFPVWPMETTTAFYRWAHGYKIHC